MTKSAQWWSWPCDLKAYNSKLLFVLYVNLRIGYYVRLTYILNMTTFNGKITIFISLT